MKVRRHMTPVKEEGESHRSKRRMYGYSAVGVASLAKVTPKTVRRDQIAQTVDLASLSSVIAYIQKSNP